MLPTNDEECRALREWAETPVATAPAATTEQLAKHLHFMAAALPSKNVNDETGKMRTAVYTSLLGGYSNAALAHMARRACETLDWFPTARQCLDLIADYRPPVSDQETALRLCDNYTTRKFNDWIEGIRAGEQIGNAPDQWLRIAVEQGVVRRLDDGRYVPRALYHGPKLAVAA